MRIRLYQALSAFSLAVVAVWVYLTLPQAFYSIDNRLRDFLFELRGPQPTTQKIVIVDIDEKSLQTYGQWPWSRDTIARLLDNLSQYGAGIIGMDIVFAEADKSSPRRIAEELGIDGTRLLDYDERLAQTLQTAPVIGGYVFIYEARDEARTPFVPAVFIERGPTDDDFIPRPKATVLNIPIIQDAYYSSGFFNNTPDNDGIIRHVPLVMRYNDMLFPSLALEMYRISQNSTQIELFRSELGAEALRINEQEFATDRFGRIAVNFRGPGHTFKYVSAADILDGNIDPSYISGKFLLLGTSAIGLVDQRATPFDSAMPGVEVHANVIDNLLAGDALHKSPDDVGMNVTLIVGVILIGALLFILVNAWLELPLFFLLLYGLYRFYDHMLFEEGTILNIIFPVVSLILTLILVTAIEYLIVTRQKQLILKVFSKKVSKAVMDDLIKHASDRLLTPSEKEVTIFFSDIRSFTTISETLGSPTRLINLLNRYMTPMVEIIMAKHGTVDKFIGDAIMAYWNAPGDVARHADRAVECAIEQIERLERLNTRLTAEFSVPIHIGIGINTGVSTIGEMGSEGRSDYTIIGDHVNLASRLEGLTKTYGASIVISEYTHAHLTGDHSIRPLDLVRVKGKHKPVEIFEVMTSAQAERFETQAAEYAEALALYRNGQMAEAAEAFESLCAIDDQLLYSLYLERCRYYLDNPDVAFDPVFTMKTK